MTFAALPGRAGNDAQVTPDLREGFPTFPVAAEPPDLGPGRAHSLELDHGSAKLDRGDPGAEEHAAETRGLAARELLERLEEQINTGEWNPFRRPRSRGQQILATLEKSATEAENGPARDPFHDRFRFNLSRGLEYRQRIPLSRQELKLKLYGPIVSGAPGLGLQLRGRLANRPFKLKALGSTNEAGLELEIEL